ncbi:protein of unknown function [Taphrina deformans PYCC 5710]|uniref:Allergen n=1 Tax=Taphrina deformans (strain PYCC 5710 / ATCC 11124 / CBS 356.35 / IMI 108563 / JCM 9778 / NBRC 8474) TaxID=1097556 RepID=R4XC95_TAPDE|nr:protein of unknown function [Taphrina deformans PYCC 5710]|eukprot:CCG81996.1 protein of unknown function [Taphrina deformans PYCC 5710]
MSSSSSHIPAAAREILGDNRVGTTQTHETVAPAVVQETIQRNIREETQIVEDREHHVHHHQQRVQPVADRQVAPEIHSHNTLAVEHREKTHEMGEGAKKALAAQQNAYQNTQTVLPTQKQTSTVAAVGQDVTHHHVHETIQPVIQRETIQQEVIHTTIPVHEVIHEKPVVHEATVEPTLTMEQFMSKGGSIQGGETVAREVRAGEPATMTGSHTSGSHEHTNAMGTHGASR